MCHSVPSIISVRLTDMNHKAPSSPPKLALGGCWVAVQCSKGRKIRELGMVSPKEEGEDSLVREGSKEKAGETVIS